MTHKTTFAVVLLLLFLAVVFADDVPRIMNYQAKLTDASGVALDGDYSITFRIYDAETGGTLLWYQTKTVTVTNGLFDEQLDLSINGGDTLKFDRPYWIVLEVESDGEMTPREKLAPVSFAFRSIYSDTAGYVEGGAGDGNNYTTGISFSGTSTKTLTLSRNGLSDLTASFTDLVDDADHSTTNELQNLSQVLGRGNTSGAHDIVLNDAGAELKIMESSGGTYYGIFDVTDLSADRTYTFPNKSGTVAMTSDIPTSDNYGYWYAKDDDGTQYSLTSHDVLTFDEGSGIDVNFTGDDVLTITHKDLSSQGSVNNSGGTVIQDVSLDWTGHVTGLASVNLDSRYDKYNNWKLQANGGTTTDISSGETVNFQGSGATTVSRSGNTITISSTDNNTTYSAGDGLDLSGTTFSVDVTDILGTGLSESSNNINVVYGSTANTAVQGNKQITITAGTGLSGGGTITLGAGGSVSLSNNDRGSSQSIFKRIQNSSGTTQFSAGSNNDYLQFAGTGGASVSFDADNHRITISASGASDGNNYTTGISFSGTSTKTLTLSRNGLTDLTASFTDNNTHLSESTVESYIANDVNTGYVPYDNGSKLVSSGIYYNGNVGIGTTSLSAKLDVNGTAEINGQLNMTNHKIVNVADPTADQDAATKHYVDEVAGSGSSSCSDLLTLNGSITWTRIHGDRDDNNKYVCVSSEFSAEYWTSARERCASIGGRLCTQNEYRDWYDDTGISSNGYWTHYLHWDDYASGTHHTAYYCDSPDCSSIDWYVWNEYRSYRCCVLRD